MMMENRLIKAALLSLAVIVMLMLMFSGRDDGQSDPDQTMTELRLPALSDIDYDWIAARIYQNEAAGQSPYLTYWGEGEDFPSFGIGHFIWFPAGVDAPFDEMFPDMVSFVRQHEQIELSFPGWLRELTPFDAPWTDKQQFDQAWDTAEMTGLRQWLEETGHLQARFIVATFEQRWRDLELATDKKPQMNRLLQNLAASPEGLFAIIDYYNFKGLGVNPRERYQGQGWGLIQVLEALAPLVTEETACVDLVEHFRQAAAGRLSLRVELSPPERNESRWLDGWLARLQGYVEHGGVPGRFPLWTQTCNPPPDAGADGK